MHLLALCAPIHPLAFSLVCRENLSTAVKDWLPSQGNGAMIKTLVSVLAGAFLAVCTSLVLAGETSIHIQDPWVREAPPSARVLAAYMRIENGSDRVKVLTGASSPSFGHVMLHGTRNHNGMTEMVHLGRVEIPPNGSVLFEPGGNHFMLMEPNQPLRAGDQVVLDLELADGSRVSVSAEVRKISAAEALPH